MALRERERDVPRDEKERVVDERERIERVAREHMRATWHVRVLEDTHVANRAGPDGF